MPDETQVDFLGVKTRASFFSQMGPPELRGGFCTVPLPSFNEEYFEWVDLFESIASARGQFTMVELGAGYGRWLVRAAFASRWFGSIPCKLVGVEAEPTHFEWMKEHFADNGLNLANHRLVRAAVSKQDGGTWFLVGAAGAWYGQKMVSAKDIARFAKQQLTGFLIERGKESQRPKSGSFPSLRLKRVNTISLNSLVRPLEKIDLIDLDIQGAELEVLTPASASLNERIRRIHIETHNQKVESGLRSLFQGLGWHSVFDFPRGSTCVTPWGTIMFRDGVQSWVNPRFMGQS